MCIWLSWPARERLRYLYSLLLGQHLDSSLQNASTQCVRPFRPMLNVTVLRCDLFVSIVGTFDASGKCSNVHGECCFAKQLDSNKSKPDAARPQSSRIFFATNFLVSVKSSDSSRSTTEMDILSKDYIGLPIIISNYDSLAMQPAGNVASRTTDQNSATSKSTTECSLTRSIERESNESAEEWTTTFTDFADAIWETMTSGMKQKLREVCVEVLHRTEDAKSVMEWESDDDARYLE